MGLLDDAIREHLELKRQHGADLGEVSRQEQEALGAPRRAEFARPEGEEAEPAAADEAPATEDAVAAEPLADLPEPIEEPEPFDVDALGEPAAPPEAVPP